MAKKRTKKTSRKPAATGELMSTRVVSLAYYHAHSKQKTPYKHEFGPGVRMYAPDDYTIVLKGTKPLSGLYTVGDNE